MKKIIIADDEMLVRVGLKTMFPWEDYGFEITAEAKNGLEALEIFEKKGADLIITDIAMPVMDGLELIRKIKHLDSPVKIIILSHHDDFEYARQAISLGVSNYILKNELTVENIANTLNKMFSEPNANFKVSDSGEEYKYRITEMLRVFLEKQIVNESDFNNVALPNKMEKRNYEFVVFNGIIFFDNITALNDISQKYKTIKHIFMDSYKIKGAEKCFYTNGKEFAAVIYADMFEKNFDTMAAEYNVLFQENVMQLLNSNLIVTASPVFNSIDNFYANIKKAQAGKTNYYFDFGYSNIEHNETNFEIDFSFLSNLLIKKNFSEAVKYLKLVFDYLYDRKDVFFSYKYLLNIYNILKEELYDSAKTISGNNNSLYTREVFNHANTFAMHTEMILAFIKKLESNSEEKTEYSYLINRAIKFINQNYFKEFSQSQLSESLGVSNGYLSSLFCKEVGCNITTYINNIRIEKAKLLLETTNKKAYEISELVGFTNPYYFSRIFKEVTGITCKKYRDLYFSEDVV